MKLEAVGGVQPLEGPDDQVGAVARDVEIGVDGERAGLAHLELQVQPERGGHHIEAGAEVGRGRGHAHHPPPAERHARR